MRRALLHWSSATAWVAVGWALVVSAWHAAWALGATVGLPAGEPRPGLGRPIFEDVAVAVGGMGLAGLALCLATGARGRAGAVVWTVARLAGAFLVIRGVAGFVTLGWSAAAGTSAGAAAAWQLWFVLGGLLFLGAAPRAGVRGRRPARAAGRAAVRSRG